MNRKDHINTHRFEWDALNRKLVWLYGPERTAAILSGNDSETNADLVRWRAMGGPRCDNLAT